MKQLILILALLVGTHAYAEKAFDRGTDAYHEAQYVDAASAFEESIGESETGAARHNLALAHYQQDEVSEAVWNLERALRLEPNNEQYHFKLGALRQQLGLLNTRPTWYEIALNSLSLQTWLITISLSFWITVAAFWLPRISGSKSNLLLAAGKSIGITGLCLGSIAIYLNRDLWSAGIVLSQTPIDLHAAPASAAPQTGIARPGERANQVDAYNSFIEIETEGGARGWVHADNFRPIQ